MAAIEQGSARFNGSPSAGEKDADQRRLELLDRTRYNTNGHEVTLTFRGGISVDYLPNGLHEPIKVGTYATAVTRHVNGAASAAGPPQLQV